VKRPRSLALAIGGGDPAPASHPPIASGNRTAAALRAELCTHDVAIMENFRGDAPVVGGRPNSRYRTAADM
jgi:hypothetical protein